MSSIEIFKADPVGFRLRFDAQELIRRACARANAKCRSCLYNPCAMRRFDEYSHAFDRLHGALVYLAAQNGVEVQR